MTRTAIDAKRREDLNFLIKYAPSMEDANDALEKFTGLRETQEKLDYLYDNFEIYLFGDPDGSLEDEYTVVLTSILNSSRR
ncbi:MAG: hypothetical protein LBR72_03820 [Oscillospiraceae bacterium]|jgi:hypothetical protein|nr:hypothetical protein [Oscillospiraceae bacterium]